MSEGQIILHLSPCYVLIRISPAAADKSKRKSSLRSFFIRQLFIVHCALCIVHYFLIHPVAPRRPTISHSPSSFRIGRVVSASSRPTFGAVTSFQA